MMRVMTLGLAVVALLTTSCDRLEGASTGPGGKAQGRYSGIGTFEADRFGRSRPTGQHQLIRKRLGYQTTSKSSS